MSVEFEASAGGKYFWLDAYTTHLMVGLSPDNDEGGGVGMTIEADEARRLRRFLEYAYPAREDADNWPGALATRCSRCGKAPADGLATINDDRYCHGDETPSCYELAQAGNARITAG